MKVGRWLQQQFILVKSSHDDDEPDRLYLDPNGHAADQLYEAAFYGSEEEAEAAKTNAKAEGDFNVAPLSYFLRDVNER